MRIFSALCFICISFCTPLRAQGYYPVKPITIVVPYNVGGGADQLARLIGHQLSERLNQTVIIDNRPGASNTIGMNYVAKSVPDGHVIGLISPGFLTAPSVIKNSYDPIKDFTGIAFVGHAPMALVVSPKLGIHNLREFVEYARSHPDKLNWASLGSTSTQGLAGLDFSQKTGIKSQQIQYKGSSLAMSDLLTGNVQYMFNALPSMIGFIDSGQLQLLGISGKKRLDIFPKTTLISDVVPDFNITSWFGFVVPVRTPKPLVDKLNKEINAVISKPEIQKKLLDSGIETSPINSEQFNMMLAKNYELYGKLLENLLIDSE